MTGKFIFLLGFALMVVALNVSAQEVTNQVEVLKFLSEASQANRSLFGYGRIWASVCRSFYNENGQKKQEDMVEAHAIYKGGKIRLDWEGQDSRLEVSRKTVATEEAFKSYYVGDTTAHIRDPRASEVVDRFSGFLPSRNSAFWHGFLESVMSGEKEVLSCKITRKDNGREVYIMELVWKKDPRNMRRYYFDPAKGGTIVKFQSYHNFGKGYVLLRQDEAELQQTSEGAWYLKRSTQVNYHPDGTLQMKEEIEIKDFDFASQVSDEVFTWEGMELPIGTTIVDRIMGDITYKYGVPPVDDKIVYDVLKQPLVQETVAQTSLTDSIQSEEETVAAQEQPQEATTPEAITEGNDNKSIQASSNRNIYLLIAAGLGLLLVMAVLVIYRRKSQAGGVE